MKDILIVSGGLLLFASWITQTFQFDKWKGRLADIQAARANFATYQSNNAVMNGLGLIASSREAQEKLWELQKRNYERGLEHLREGMSTAVRGSLTTRIDEVEIEYRNMGPFARGQAEVIVVQEEFGRERTAIFAKQRRAQKVLWATYAAGTLALVAGNLF
jgi:hypothetical protein